MTNNAGKNHFLLSLLAVMATLASAEARPRNLQELADIGKKLTESGIQYGQIPSLYRPRFDRMQDAGLSMNGDDVVFVVMLPDGPRIYPQKYLVWHQVINEVIDDVAYAITYSPITGSFAAYNASMSGLNLILDADGRLYDGNSVLVDRNSGSLWLQELGMAFDGSLLGRGLPLVPAYWTTWEPARRCFPTAKVMSRPPGRRAYGRDPYGDYRKADSYYTNDELIYPVQRVDRRFPRKTPMLCLEYQGALLAIDIKYVKEKGAVNFFVGPAALLAVHDKKLDVVRVFNRQVWADPFLFVYIGNQLMDIGTRSIWDPATGTCLEGNLKGASMAQSFGMYSMWFAWASLNPETLFIPGPGEVPAELLQITPLGQPGAIQQRGASQLPTTSAPRAIPAGALPPSMSRNGAGLTAAPAATMPAGMTPAAPNAVPQTAVPAGALPQGAGQTTTPAATMPTGMTPAAPNAAPQTAVPAGALPQGAGQTTAPAATMPTGMTPAAPNAVPPLTGGGVPTYGISPGGYAPAPPAAAAAAPAATGRTPGPDDTPAATGVGAVAPPGAAVQPLPQGQATTAGQR